MLTVSEAFAEASKTNLNCSITESELFMGFIDLLLNKNPIEVFNVPRGMIEQIHPTCLKRFLISESRTDKITKRQSKGSYQPEPHFMQTHEDLPG